MIIYALIDVERGESTHRLLVTAEVLLPRPRVRLNHPHIFEVPTADPWPLTALTDAELGTVGAVLEAALARVSAKVALLGPAPRRLALALGLDAPHAQILALLAGMTLAGEPGGGG